MSTLAEKVRLRLNAVGDDFYPDEFIVECLNKAQDYVINSAVSMEKASVSAGTKKSFRILDTIRRSTEITPSGFTSFQNGYTSTANLPTTFFNSFTTAKYKSGDSYAVARELSQSEIHLFEHGNVVPSLKECYYYISTTHTQGVQYQIIYNLSGLTIPSVGSGTLTVRNFVNGTETLLNIDTVAGESTTTFTARVAYEINRYSPLRLIAQSTGTTLILTAEIPGSQFNSSVSLSENMAGSITTTSSTNGTSNSTLKQAVLYTKTNLAGDRFILSYYAIPRKIAKYDTMFSDLPEFVELSAIYKACSYALVKEEMGEKQIKASEQFEALFQREFMGALQ